MAVPLKVLSLNVRGLNNVSKRISLFKWVEDKKIDIACLQETFCKQSFQNMFDNSCTGKVFHAFSDSSHSRGVCIILRKSLNYTVLNQHKSIDGRRLLLNIDINGEIYTIVNLYAPNVIKDRINFLKKNTTWIKQYASSSDRLIICADMNCCMNRMDRNGENGDKSNAHLNMLCKALKVNDVWRDLNPGVTKYTYREVSRIDYILASQLLSTMSTMGEIIQVPSIPDHKGVIIVMGDSLDRGQGYWKLNTSILGNESYKKVIIQVINQTMQEHFDLQPTLLWEMVKIRVKEATIRFCSALSRSQRKETKELERQLADIEDIMIIKCDPLEYQRLCRIKDRLKEIYDEAYINKAKAAQVRSKARYIEEGEKSTSFFLSLEKRNQINNSIYSVEKDDGSVITDTTDMINETRNFYERLYTSEGISQEDINRYLQNVTAITALSEEEAILCEGDITESECLEALNKMKPGKSPGDDGLPYEFYITFWDHIKTPLVNSFRYSYINGHLSESQRRAIITLIHKKGNKKQLKNYRPISLTNIDYKILAFALSIRLQAVLDKVIGTQQTAYIKGRFIGQNIRSVLDIIEYTDREQIPGLMLCLDFHKAFDSLEWNFMISVLKKFNFGTSFIKWIQLLYDQPIAKLKVNGWISEPIRQTRGIRQGCPVSAMAFILCTEILATAILDNNEIEGIPLPSGKEGDIMHKASQYADDTTVFLKDEYQVLPVLETIAEFSAVAGLSLNIEKTEAMWLGSFKHRKDRLFNFNWPPVIRYLGIYIGYDETETYKRNWEDKLELFQKTLDCWRTRELTLFGRVVIVKTLGMAKITYCATMLPVPLNVCEKLDKEIDKFLWNGRKRRIKKAILYKPITEGGIGQLNLQTYFEALKASWVPRILRQQGHQWAGLPAFYLSYFGKDLAVLNFNFTSMEEFPYIKKLPLFYQEVIVAFNKAKHEDKPENMEELLNSVMWGNRHFLYNIEKAKKGKSIYNRHWIECGIIKVGHVVTQQGVLNIDRLRKIVVNKQDFISTQSKILAVLRPYKHLFTEARDVNTLHLGIKDPSMVKSFDKYVDISKQKSKFFYCNILANCRQKLRSIEKWADEFECSINVNEMFMNRVKMIKDRKIAAFNFKILHKILICGETLFQWKKIDSYNCSVCKELHTVKHMLYDCRYAKYVWSLCHKAVKICITWKNIVLGYGHKLFDFIVSQLTYLLYKAWILELNDKKVNNFKQYLYYELNEKVLIYKVYHYKEVCESIQGIIDLIL